MNYGIWILTLACGSSFNSTAGTHSGCRSHRPILRVIWTRGKITSDCIRMFLAGCQTLKSAGFPRNSAICDGAGHGASWLPLTRNQMEGLKKVADEYAGRGVVVYWVSTESDSAKSKNFVGDDELRTLGRKYKITVLRDPDGPISRRLGVDQLPATVIINKEGQVAASVGGLDPNADIAKQLAERLNKIL